MRTIKLHLSDTFSGCKDIRIKQVTDREFSTLQDIKYRAVTIPEFSNNIRFNWIIERIEPVNKENL